jgi:Family of unknown function (DUF6529)
MSTGPATSTPTIDTGSAVSLERKKMAILLLVWVGVASLLAAYAKIHHPTGRTLFTLGFTGLLQMKAWLTTAAVVFVIVQLVTALWMWGRLPGAGAAPPWASVLHRWTGTIAFVLTLPVVFNCIWVLGFVTTSPRVVIHCVAGCLFYGAYAAKMLGLRIRGLPGWAIPVLGGSVFGLLIVLWLTSALWLFTRQGIPLT